MHAKQVIHCERNNQTWSPPHRQRHARASESVPICTDMRMYVLRESAAPPLPRAISYATKAGSPEPLFPCTPRCHLHSLGSMQLGLWACSKHPCEARAKSACKASSSRHPAESNRPGHCWIKASLLAFSARRRTKGGGVRSMKTTTTCSKHAVACLQYHHCQRAPRQAPWRCFAVPVVRLRFKQTHACVCRSLHETGRNSPSALSARAIETSPEFESSPGGGGS